VNLLAALQQALSNNIKKEKNKRLKRKITSNGDDNEVNSYPILFFLPYL
jgi:hypothetical protein